MMATGAEFHVVEVGHLTALGVEPCDTLYPGEVGYLTAAIKNVSDTRVGDTVTYAEGGAEEPLPGYRAAQPMVYSGLYTADTTKYPDLRDALEKLVLNDASLVASRNPLRHSVLAFAAAFSGCCTWRSFRNALSANSIWI